MFNASSIGLQVKWLKDDVFIYIERESNLIATMYLVK